MAARPVRPRLRHGGPSGADETELARLFASAAFGLRLLEPVDAYRQTERMAKYGVLVRCCSTLSRALIIYEVVVRAGAYHPCSTGWSGWRWWCSHLLLLSLAERLGFTPA